MTIRASFYVARSQMIKILNLNISGTKRDVALKQRPDRFPYIGDYNQVALLLSIPGYPQDIRVVLISMGSRTFKL